MRGEHGQASVEWIAVIALIAISLGALARGARGDDDHALTATLVHSVTCAARDGHRCAPTRAVAIRGERRTESQPARSEAFNAPFLVPNLSPAPSRPAQRPPIARSVVEWARRRLRRELAGPLRPAVRGRLRAGAGRAWRSAWFACLVYERVRWAILHPESRSHEYEFPPSEAIRILNDCVSPLDLVRDWALLTPR